jgi:hypothetical protein
MKFPLTSWPKCLLQDLLPPILFSQNTTPRCYSQLWNNYNAKEWNPFSS